MPYGSPRFSGSMGLLRLASARAAARSVTAMGQGNHREIAIGPRIGILTGLVGGLVLAASLPGYVVATLLQAAILAAGLALVSGRGWRRAVAFPAALVLVEAVRGSW